MTAAFEVIDVDSDRHIVHYDHSGLRLLHLIRNQDSFAIDSAHEDEFSDLGGFQRPQVLAVARSGAELAEAIQRAWRSDREGAVLYFADGWMVKVKSDRYRLVKSLRPLLQRALLRDRPISGKGETAGLARRVVDYARRHGIDLTYRRAAFGELDVDMTKVGGILDAMHEDSASDAVEPQGQPPASPPCAGSGQRMDRIATPPSDTL